MCHAVLVYVGFMYEYHPRFPRMAYSPLASHTMHLKFVNEIIYVLIYSESPVWLRVFRVLHVCQARVKCALGRGPQRDGIHSSHAMS